MKSVQEMSGSLRQREVQQKYGKLKLASDSGITYRTLNHVLSGSQDYKVSTLLAVADRLGLEVKLVPKEASSLFDDNLSEPARAPTRVSGALRRLRDAQESEGSIAKGSVAKKKTHR